ncbi:MAG: LLM class flavin-dependent oxidoreductase, partial [Candidatus Binataceae bacterium]
MSGKIEFAFWSPQAGATVKILLDRAELAERLGYHSFWLVDHFWTLGLPDVDLLEAITMMSAIAARTERVRIGTLVLCNSFRNPALLAKMAATLQFLSGGRFILGLGTGWHEEEYR